MNVRTTRYSKGVMSYMAQFSHATNAELLAHLKQENPDLSATTIHRVTTRLAERGELAVAPAARGNIMRFDINTEPHDHFHCSSCDMLRDATVAHEIRPTLEKAIGNGCKISGNLVISGICKDCNERML